MPEHYDVIVIGSGPGGASLAQALAPTGKRILILERGDYLPREEANWSAQAVFVDGRYQAAETWTNAKGDAFSPQLHYYVGGNSKVYGSALFRLRERDFDEIVHAGGVSPAWPLKYSRLRPLLRCRGDAVPMSMARAARIPPSPRQTSLILIPR